jgi:hypothetical protein
VTAERGRPPGRDAGARVPGARGPRRLPAQEPSPGGPPGPRGLVGLTTPSHSALGGAAPTSRGPRRLARPRLVRVRADATGRPEAVEEREVEAVRESWLIEDRWWTEAPLRRRYWEVVTADGRDLVVYRDLEEGRWYAQR